MDTYYSNGKVLLTGEYFVLKGAKAIALPVRFGQKLEVSKSSSKNQISWKAFHPNGLWFSCKLELPDFKILQSNHRAKAKQLVEIFNNIKKLKPEFLFNQSLDFETYLNFNPEWGLGSSSTLIANLSKWSGVDPFQLNELSFGGSGFDVACASANGPVLYKKGEEIIEIELKYPFHNQLFFIYSGRKKGTKNEVQRFLSKHSVSKEDVIQMDLLSNQFANAKNLPEFQQLIERHEQMGSEAVGIKPLKETYFADFNGAVKSLGAWGGDFFLVATGLDIKAVRSYFNAKGFEVIFPWNELVLNKS